MVIITCCTLKIGQTRVVEKINQSYVYKKIKKNSDDEVQERNQSVLQPRKVD